MKQNKFKTIEDDGIVIFDSSDDYVPGEEHVLDDDDEFDTDYLLRETARQEAQQAKEQVKQRWISVGVIVAVISFVAGVCYINFKDIL